MATIFRNSSLRVGEMWNLFKQPDGTWRSRTYGTLAISLGNVEPGDIIDVRLDHEFSVAIPGAGAVGDVGTDTTKRTEHWFCWVMASTSVLVGTKAQLGTPGVELAGGGTYIIPPQETNWDNLIHHLGVSRSGLWQVPAPITDAYVWSRVYFLSGASYTPPTGGTVTIHDEPYCLLSARVDKAA